MTLDRRTLYLPLANLWFIATSAAILFGLPNLLDVEEVGDYGIVTRLISLLSLMVIAASALSVSKHVAAAPEATSAIRRSALRAIAVASGAASVAVFVFAGPIGALLGDQNLVPLIRGVAITPVAYGVYAVQTGALNGRQVFGVQAALDTLQSSLRLLLILGAGAVGLGLHGCLAGFVAAVVIAALVAFVDGQRRFPNTSSSGYPVRALAAFAAPVLVQSGLMHSLILVDLLLVKGLSPGGLSKVISGAYYSMLNVPLISYTLMGSVGLVAFPKVASAVAKSLGELKTVTSAAIRVGLLLPPLMLLVAAASPEDLVRLIYPTKPEFVSYAPALTAMVIGYCFLCLLGLQTTIANAIGRPGLSVVAAAGTVFLQITLCLQGYARLGVIGAAGGSAVAFASGALFLSFWLRRLDVIDSILPSLLRVAFAASGAWLIGRALPFTGLLLVVEAVILAGTFVMILVIIREVSPAELRSAWSLLRPARAGFDPGLGGI